jgi:hypothetical protein
MRHTGCVSLDSHHKGLINLTTTPFPLQRRPYIDTRCSAGFTAVIVTPTRLPHNDTEPGAANISNYSSFTGNSNANATKGGYMAALIPPMQRFCTTTTLYSHPISSLHLPVRSTKSGAKTTKSDLAEPRLGVATRCLPSATLNPTANPKPTPPS